MIDIVSRVQSPAGRSPVVTLSPGTGWPRKGDSISVVMTAAGHSRNVEGVVISLEPRTSVSAGRLLMQDTVTGQMIDLPAPVTTQE